MSTLKKLKLRGSIDNFNHLKQAHNRIYRARLLPYFGTFLSPLMQFYLLFSCLFPLLQFIYYACAYLDLPEDKNCKIEDKDCKRGDK